MSCKKNFDACGSIGILISIVFGALIAVLFNLGLITFLNIAVWIVFGLSVLFLILLVAGVYLSAVSIPGVLRYCVSKNGLCLLAATIGTLISAIVALSIVLNPASILITIFIAVFAFFFALMIIALIALLRCIITNLFPGDQP
ncbi:MAG TPA: hypothetical protein PLD48_06985 [Bacillota bacterium]|nr:hypothetical protein [Bacillota bacterium]HOK69118.1 hypothetical protein [Bacillota bacterium]HPP85550.1 hypothetical protein [Bacillota bacterium]